MAQRNRQRQSIREVYAVIRVETCPHESDAQLLLDLIEGGRDVHIKFPEENQ